MRDIKFRAWNIDKKRWETDYERCYLNEEGCCEIEFTNMYTSGLRRINAVVNLYTGLKDKNGKEIYEGDILESKEGIFTIEEWGDGVYRVVSNGMTWDWLHQLKSKGYLEHGKGNYEIIGNIYEHPHLLNSDKEVQGSVARDGASSTKAD